MTTEAALIVAGVTLFCVALVVLAIMLWGEPA